MQSTEEECMNDKTETKKHYYDVAPGTFKIKEATATFTTTFGFNTEPGSGEQNNGNLKYEEAGDGTEGNGKLVLEEASSYPMGYNKIYTLPELSDGTYNYTVNANFVATWKEKYKWWEIRHTLNCTIPEHQHSASCLSSYPVYSNGVIVGYNSYLSCGMQPHTHQDSCYTPGWVEEISEEREMTYDSEASSTLTIKGSMFDDDQQIISR
jgi:hypothetical protein